MPWLTAKFIFRERRSRGPILSLTFWFEMIVLLLLFIKDDAGAFWRLVLWISYGQ